MNLKNSFSKSIAFGAIIVFSCIFPTYAADNPNVLQDVKVEVNSNIMKIQERRLPSLYLGNLQRNYNLSEKLTLNVKDQGNTQMCWACSSNTVLETTVNLANKTNHIFSHEALANQVSNKYGISIDEGGNSYVAYGHYTSGEIPVNLKQEEVNVKIEDYTIFSSVYKKLEGDTVKYQKSIESDEQYVQDEVETIRQSIKNHIMNYGAVTALTYSDIKYFNDNLQAYYCYSNGVYPNHQVTIVGWDDNYKKENFMKENDKQKILPKSDGAYIVLNSYGKDFGKDGLFYVSYDDAFIEYSNFGITKTSSYEEEENIYQYDELGMNNEIGFKADAYAANVYTRKTQKLEVLSSISFGSLENGEYEVYINPNNEELDITKMKKVKEITTRKSRIYNSRN